MSATLKSMRVPKLNDTQQLQVRARVADIKATYDEWRSKGAVFLTPPIDRGAEIRCYMRDPDGYLIEVGEATGMLKMLDDMP